jgi:hypothetical protein
MFVKLRRRAAQDRGVALAMVIGIGAVLMMMVTVCVTYSVSGLVRSKHDQDWNAAISAAYAGVADYQGRVTNDSSYAQWGNPAASFTKANNSQGSVTLPTGTLANAAFNIAKGAAWAPVPAAIAGTTTPAWFRYEVDNSKYASSGVLRVRATGKVGTTTRSVVANIKQTGFTNYVYFTDYEILDPTVNSTTCTIAYAWQSSTTKSSACTISFIAKDSLDGQVHSNDTLNICDGTFKQAVTTSNPKPDGSGKLYSQNNCSAPKTPNFSLGAPTNSALITMPPPTQQLDQTRSDIPTRVPLPGCLYTGPTKITFYLSNPSDPTSQPMMNVISPYTKKVQIVGNPPTSATTPQPTFCGTPGNPAKSQANQTANTLAAAGGQNIPIDSSSQLYNNLIYVQSVPTTSTDPNYWSSSTSPYNNAYSCKGADGTSAGNGLGFPMTNELVPTSTGGYGCRAGDAFVQGTMHSAMTINADHYLYVTGKLSYADPAHDILGLVGAGSVFVWNPVQCTATSNGNCTATKNLLTFEATSTSTNCARTINAAILSNLHSFEVQNYDKGSFLGKLCVTGSIAQEFRGPVGLADGSAGFTKTYSYDTRLLNTPPPKFPTPRTTSYDLTTQIEVGRAFLADGTPTS